MNESNWNALEQKVRMYTIYMRLKDMIMMSGCIDRVVIFYNFPKNWYFISIKF